MNEFQFLTVAALPLLFAITLHEVAHGWVAKQLGDPTAQMMGRLTVNPLRHIDPLGTVILPALMLIFAGFFFGWAKPVPVNFRNLRHPRRDMVFVAAAGPGANLLMALIWAGVMKLGLALQGAMPGGSEFIELSGAVGIWLNLILMVLNLLPIPPLDGGRVLSGLLPPRLSAQLDRIEPYGIFILLGIMLLGGFEYLIKPALCFGYGTILQIFGLTDPLGLLSYCF